VSHFPSRQGSVTLSMSMAEGEKFLMEVKRLIHGLLMITKIEENSDLYSGSNKAS
jgi:hypothetical protein